MRLRLFLIGILFSHAAAVAQLPGRFVNPRAVLDLNFELVSPAISADGLSMYFGGICCSRAAPGFGETDIYVVTRDSQNDVFSPDDVVNLGANLNTEFDDNKPFVTPDELTIYFHSDRPGGMGNVDLYMATRDSRDAEFGNVTNLGPDINTVHTDAGPYFSADGTELYFHSNRPGSRGPRNIFRAIHDETTGAFSDITNLEVNAISWDGDVSLSSDGLTMFFNSSRPGQATNEFQLWMAQRDTLDSPWQAPFNLDEFSLGSTINSEASGVPFHPEISPDWPANGSKLYFAMTVGARDFEIFEATWQTVPEPSCGTILLTLALLLVCRRKRAHK